MECIDYDDYYDIYEESYKISINGENAAIDSIAGVKIKNVIISKEDLSFDDIKKIAGGNIANSIDSEIEEFSRNKTSQQTVSISSGCVL